MYHYDLWTTCCREKEHCYSSTEVYQDLFGAWEVLNS